MYARSCDKISAKRLEFDGGVYILSSPQYTVGNLYVWFHAKDVLKSTSASPCAEGIENGRPDVTVIGRDYLLQLLNRRGSVYINSHRSFAEHESDVEFCI